MQLTKASEPNAALWRALMEARSGAMRDLWHPDIIPVEPNSGDEANLTKWGWPSPALSWLASEDDKEHERQGDDPAADEGFGYHVPDAPAARLGRWCDEWADRVHVTLAHGQRRCRPWHH